MTTIVLLIALAALGVWAVSHIALIRGLVQRVEALEDSFLWHRVTQGAAPAPTVDGASGSDVLSG